MSHALATVRRDGRRPLASAFGKGQSAVRAAALFRQSRVVQAAQQGNAGLKSWSPIGATYQKVRVRRWKIGKWMAFTPWLFIEAPIPIADDPFG